MRGFRLSSLMLFWLAVSVQATEVYRWVDADGSVHYGNRPQGDATLVFRTPERPQRAPEEARRGVAIARVIDGDTVQLTTGQRVRLVGINAPEIAVAGKPGQAGGQDAKARLEALAAQDGLTFEGAQETADRYGRLLGYLFDAEGRDLATILLAEGLVFAVPYPPNVKYADAYVRAEAPARRDRLGLWAQPEFGVVESDALADAGNRFRRVRLVVAGMTRNGGDNVLRDRRGFEVRIPKEVAGDFPPMSQLLSRTLVLRGFVRSHRGKPYLALAHPSQIEQNDLSGE